MKNENLKSALVLMSQIAVRGDDVDRMFIAKRYIQDADKEMKEKEEEADG